MKRTRVAEFVARLTCWRWRYRYADLRNQPCYIFSEEIDIEEAKRRYGVATRVQLVVRTLFDSQLTFGDIVK